MNDYNSALSNSTYLDRDLELWSKNSNKIYNGEMSKSELYFYEKDLTKCFLDFTRMDNINIRNMLLLYDQVFMGCPAEDFMEEFLGKQNVSKDELLELCNKGRIKLVACGADAIYNKDFLNEVFRENEDSIISSKAMCCLLVCDMVEMADIGDTLLPSDYEKIRIICNSLGQKGDDIFNAITWPLKAKKLSLKALEKEGVTGVNQLEITKQLYSELNKLDCGRAADIELTLLLNSHNIFIASALDATYFPYFMGRGMGDEFAANVLGSLLNQYKLSVSNINDYKELLEKNNLRKRVEIGAINLLNAKEELGVLKLENFAMKNKTTQYLKDILMGLEEIKDNGERNKKIQEYNNLIYEIQEGSLEKMPNPTSYMLGGFGFIPSCGWIFSIVSLVKMMMNDMSDKEKKQAMKIIDRVSERIIEKKERENIYLLSKIDRVARLRSANID